jgi:GNAT superfamily N-acetyltransferase
VGGGVRVREATVEDLQALRALLRGLHDPPSTISENHGIWHRMLTDPNRTILLGERDGFAVGTADVLVVPNLTFDGSPWAVVENLIVHPEYRGIGTGTALMEAAVALAETAGCYKLQLASSMHRTRAHRFYDALGFERAAIGFRRHLRPPAARGAA